ncbi:MAG: ComEC/Rec2 family competence protein [Bdellovibrionales bacterium]
MLLIMILLWLGPFFSPTLDLGPDLEEWSRPLQNWCAAQIIPNAHHELTRAMVCGIDPTHSEQMPFLHSGLYHLLVVSGAHLAFFAAWLKPLRHQRFGNLMIFLLLGLYTLTCGAQPPVFRALLQWLCMERRQSLGVHSHIFLLTWLSGILCLSLVPSWIHSLSFWLSWLAALACQLAMHLRLSAGPAALLIHGLMLPGLLSLGAAHPVSVLNNWLFAPLLSSFLFPLCLLTCLFSPLAWVSDFIWSLLIQVLSPLNQLIETTPIESGRGAFIAYVVIVQIVLWQGWIWWQRKF